MPRDMPKHIETIVSPFIAELQRQLARGRQVRKPADFLAAERAIGAVSRRLADAVTGALLRECVGNVEFQAQAAAAAYAGPISYRSGGAREVTVTLAGGGTVTVKTPYLRRDRRRSRGPKRTKRGRSGTGLYPVLAALGIQHRVSPTLAEDLAFHVASCDSIRTARSMLDRRGIDLGHRRTLAIVGQVGDRAASTRTTWLCEMAGHPPPDEGLLLGKRVVVTADGGRLRERRNKRGRRKSNGHRRFSTSWREPKLFTIYTIDADGDVDRTFRPVQDGTLADADGMFTMLTAYLRALGAHRAAEVIFVGDGAHWIWNRVAQLVTEVGVPADRVHQLIDWYHAVEHLHAVAKLPQKWTDDQRNHWVKRMKDYLHAGHAWIIAAAIDRLAVGRRAKAVKEHRAYFADNEHRMQYANFQAANRPKGSGAVESAIRRVINMRLKAPGSFWYAHRAEQMILMRAYVKAGRWHDLFLWSLSRAAPWWPPAAADALTPLLPHNATHATGAE